MGGLSYLGRHQRAIVLVLVGVLGAACAASLALWIVAPSNIIVLGDAQDAMELALDRAMVRSVDGFYLWHKINVLVQSGAILFGIAATILTASATDSNAARIKVATVTATALATGLISIQSTFHIRENLSADAVAYGAIVQLEMGYIYDRSRLDGSGSARAALMRDTEVKLGRIRLDQMTALAAIGGVDRGEERGGDRP